jgi:hypothetical protein
MSKSYYEASRDILIKKLDCLRNRRYVDFFRQSDEFELAIGLSYFALAEELLVEKDSRNLDIATRFTKHVDDSRLRSLITDDIIIHDKEDDGNSPEWFLVALRNGIIHNGFTVDYENRRVNVVNNGAANKLDCSISFDWFKKFLMDDLLLNRTFDNYKYTVVLNPFVKVEDATHMSSFDDVRNFIENELPAYDIEIFFDDTHGDKNKIGREEFTLFCGDRQTLFWRLQNTPEELTKEELDRLEKHKSTVEGELADIKGSLSEAEYYKRYYSKLFNYWFTEEFKAEYPNYNIKISDFSRKSPRLNMVVSGMNNDELEKQLLPTFKKKREFFFNTAPVFQRMDIASLMSRVVNYDAVDYLNSMQYLFSMYDMHKDAVRDDYKLSRFMDIILRSGYVDTQKIQNAYLKAIYFGMLEEGVVHSYDEQITENIVRVCEYYDDDIYVRCRALCEEYYEEELSKVTEILKKEFPNIYKNAANELRRIKAPSDQVLSVYSENDLYRLCNAKGVINNELNEIIVGLLYTLGINTYVVNKETKFLDLTEDDYSFMDGLNIKGYSKDVHTFCVEKRNKRSGNNKTIKSIDRNLSGLNAYINAATDPSIVKEKRNVIAEQLGFRQERIDENTELNEYLDGRVDAVFGGINMSSLRNAECATTIRNCFAHSGRIFVEGREPGGEFKLVLTDYDENGNLSGVVKTDLSSLIEFFSHSVFKKTMDEKTSVSTKSK